MPFAGTFLIAIAAGFIGAASGMGGGALLIPALTLCGVDIRSAIAVSVISAVAVANTAGVTYVRGHLANLKASAFSEVWGVVGALAGASLTLAVERRWLFIVCGALFLLVGVGMFLGSRRIVPGRWPLWASPAPPGREVFASSYYDRTENQTIAYAGQRPWLSALGMVGAGVMAGVLGMGTGALTILVYGLIMRFPPKVALTTSHLVVGVMALASASVYLEAGLLNLSLVVPVVLGAPVGALLGSAVVVRLPNRTILLLFLSLIAVLGVHLIVRGVVWGA